MLQGAVGFSNAHLGDRRQHGLPFSGSRMPLYPLMCRADLRLHGHLLVRSNIMTVPQCLSNR